MLTCQQLTELVTDYLEGRMSSEEQVRFRTHMEMCKPCRVFIEQMEQTIELMGRLPDDVAVPESVRTSLRAAFASWRTDEHGEAE